jgi:FecR-like protein/Big-like domain-containing protein
VGPLNKFTAADWGGLSAPESVKFDFHNLSSSGRAETVTVPDAHLLFSGNYERSGKDLIISDEVHRYVLHDYFVGEKRPTLVSPEGAPLDPRFIEAVTGHTVYAQAGAPTPSGDKVVGHVITMTGSASIIRNGVAIVVNTGDVLYQNDVVQTGSNSTLGMVIDDGSAFNLAANSRFMLNELDYDPAGTANKSLFSLVQGSLSFIAGQVAPTGDMKVTTPVATVGIRGTAVLLDIDSADGKVAISVADQQDGRVHVVEVFNLAGDRIGSVSSNGPSLSVIPGANFQVTLQEIIKTTNQVAQEFSSFQQLLTTYDTGKQQFPSLPQHTENTNQNNTNTGTTKAAVGSPPTSPSSPPVTTVFADASDVKNAGAEPAVQVTTTTTSEDVTGTTSAQSSAPVATPAVLPLTQTPVEITNTTGGQTTQTTQTISGTIGTAFVGTVVTLFDTSGGVTTALGATTVGAGGVWSEVVTLNGAGVHTIVAVDSSANSTSTPVSFTLAAAGPSVTIAPIEANNIINAAEAARGVTLSGSVSGLDANSTFDVVVTDAGVTKTYIATVNGAGTAWSATIPAADAAALADGTAIVSVQVTDANGNPASASQTVTVAETGPAVTIAPIDGNNLINAAEAARGVTLSGSVSGIAANATFDVTVTDNGVTKTYVATVNAAGTAWSATVPAADAKALADGLATVSAQVIDANGNPASASQTVTVAETGPTVTIAPIDGNNVINAAQAAGGVALGGSVSGIAANSTFTVTVTDNGATKVYVATVDPTGTTWSAAIPAADAKALADGIATVSAQVLDANGNSGSASQAVTVAETAPTVTIATVDGNDVINVAKAEAGVALSGSVSGIAANSTFTVTVTDAGVVKTYVATVNTAGTGWNATIPAADATALANGTATVSVQVIDANGNSGAASHTVTVAETAPTVTIATVDNNDVINIAKAEAGVALSGAVSGIAPNSTFTVTVTDAGVTKSYLATVDGNGTGWNATIPAADATALVDGTATISAQVTDANGNQASATHTVTVAETAPTVTIAPVEGNNIIGAAAATTDVALSGSVSGLAANSTFDVTVTDAGVTKTYIATVDAAGKTWSATIPAADTAALANGTATVSAQVTDANGNQGSATQTVIVAETGPAVTIAPVDGNNIINAVEAAAAVALSGSVSGIAANSTFDVTVTDAGVTKTYIATVDAAGNTWSATIPAADEPALADGTLLVSAQVTDVNGNQASASLAIAKETVAPTVLINTAGITTDQPVQTISGTVTTTEAAAGNTVTLFDVVDGVSTEIGTAPVSNGAWSANVTLLGDGTHNIVAVDTDAAGNLGTSAPVVFTLVAAGQSIEWTNPNGGDFATGSNWNTGFAPGPADSAVIDAVGTYTVTTSQNESVQSLQLGAGATLEVGAGETLAVSASTTIVAHSQLLLDQGANLQISGQISNAGGQDVNPFAPSSFLDSGIVASAGATLQISGTASFESNGAILLGANSTIENAGSTSATLDNIDDLFLWTASGKIDGLLTFLNEAPQTLADQVLPAEIAITGAGNILTIDPASFTNDSFVEALNGASIQIGDLDAQHVFTNLQADTNPQTDPSRTAGDELSGGSYLISDGAVPSVISFTGPNALPITTLNAAVTLFGQSADLVSDGVDLAQSLTLIDTAGSLQLGFNSVSNTTANFSDPNSVDIKGFVSLDGGNFDTDGLTIESGANVFGAGQLSTVINDSPHEIVNDGSVTASGALDAPATILEINASDITGTGTLVIEGGDTLIIDATQINAGQTFASVGKGQTVIFGPSTSSGGGTLQIGGTEVDSNTFGATISGFALGDKIDLAGIVGGDNYSFDGSVLAVKSGDAVLATLTLSGLAATTVFQVGSDGSGGGTAITIVADTGPTVTIAPIEGNNVINAAQAAADVALNGLVSGLAANSTFEVTVTDAGVTKTYVATVDGTGAAWSATIPAADATALADGTATVSVLVTDANGLSASTSQTVTVAETPPTVTTLTDATSNGNDLKAGQTVTFTLVATEALSVADGAALTLNNGATAVFNSSSGTFVYTVAAGQDISDLKVTGYSGSITDAFGNPLVAGGVSLDTGVKVDTTTPIVTIGGTGGNASQSSVTISGSVDVGDARVTVEIFDNGGTTPVATTTVQSDGSWSTSVALVAGTNLLTAQVTDAAGNTGTSNTLTFTLPNFTTQWIGPNGGSWGTGANWSTGIVPGSGDSVLIGVADNVVFSTGSSVIDALFSTAGSTLSVSGGTFTINNTSSSSDLQGSVALSGGTLSTGGQMLVAAITESGGTLTGAGLLTVTGGATFTANSSTESGIGTTLIEGGASIATANSFSLTLSRTLELQGASTVTGTTGGAIGLGTSGTLKVDSGATFNDESGTAGAGLTINGTGTSSVINDGTWEKTVGTGTTIVNAAFSSTGTSGNLAKVDVETGTLDLAGGGSDTFTTYIGAGTIDFGGGTRTLDANSSIATANVQFTGGSTTVNGSYSAATGTTVTSGAADLKNGSAVLGALSMANGGGTLTLEGSATATSLTETSGTLTGAGLLTVTGGATFTANSSTESGTGTTLVEGGASIATPNSFSLTLSRTLELQGASTVTGTTGGSIGLGTSGTLKIDSGATFNDESGTAGAGLTINGTGTSSVINDGTWEKTVGAGTTIVNAAFSSTGTSGSLAKVDVETGTLDLAGGGSDTFTTYIGAGTIDFGGGTRTLDANSSIATANVQFTGGSTTVNGSYSAATGTTVTSGAADLKDGSAVLGALSMANGGGTLTLEGSATATSLTETSGTLTGAGLLTVTGGATFTANSSTESGIGTTLIEGGASIATANSFSLTLSRTLELQGASTVTGTTGGSIGLGTSGTLKFDSGATFNDESGTAGTGLTINGTGNSSVINAGTWKKTVGTGTTTIGAAFSNIGTVTVQSGTLLLSGAVANSNQLDANGGNVTISGTLTNVATAQIGIANATVELAAVLGGLNVTFGGTSGLLKLDSTVSSGQSAGISAVSTNAPTEITASGSISSTVADAVDVTSGGGAVSLTTGAVTGALSGFSVTQNGTGDVTVTASGPVVGQDGRGIFVDVSATGNGGILINGSGNVTGTGTGNSGIFAEILNAADDSDINVRQTGSVISGGLDGIRAVTQGNGNITVATGPNATISGAQEYGIIALSFGTGNLSVSTALNDTIKSFTAGIVAQNDAASIPQVGGLTASTITVTTAPGTTINSGSAPTATGNPPAGIIAGFNGTGSGNGSFSPNLFGDVLVNNSATINAKGGDGIRTFNVGNGNISVNDLSSTTITAPGRFGISASVDGVGDIKISNAAGDTINSGSSGIEANNIATSVPAAAASSINITAAGNINSGFGLANGNTPAGIVAGYAPGGQGSVSGNSAVQGGVIVDSSAVIKAAAGDGIELHNFGAGSLTATLEGSSAITAPLVGVSAFAPGAVNISVINHGTITAANGAGISAVTGIANNVPGVVTVTNTGAVAALGSESNAAIVIGNNNPGDASTQDSFTNSGTVTSQLFSTGDLDEAIASFNDSITINNSNIISGDVELGTATFTNDAGAVWNDAGSSSFGSGANFINNAGTINISGGSFFTAAGTLAFDNTGAVNLAPDSFAFIGGPVSGVGSFSIGHFSKLEFLGAVASGQTVSFTGNNGLLALVSPSPFTISGMAVGNTIDFVGSLVSNETISPDGSSFTVTVQTASGPETLTYDLVNFLPASASLPALSPSSVRFDQLTPSEIALVQISATPITGSSPILVPSSAAQQSYILSGAAISGTGNGFDDTSTGSTPSQFLSVVINQGSSIAVSGAGLNLATSGTDISVSNAGNISAGGRGISTNSGTGNTVIFDTSGGTGPGTVAGNISGSTAINAVTTTGSIEIGLDAENSNPTVTNITGTAFFGISATTSGGDVFVSTAPFDTIHSASSGINAIDQASSVTSSSILVSNSGTIFSGSTLPSSGSEPAGIKAGFNGGSNLPTTTVTGDVTVDNNGNITAAAGMGINAFNDGIGDISVSDGPGTTITATGAGSTVGLTNAASYGIAAFGLEAGNTTITTGFGSTIISGSSGIDAVNQATAISAAAPSTITVVALGSITSGANLTNANSTPAGIEAGFNTSPGATSTFDPNVNGSIFVDFGGASLVSGAGPGIRAFNLGVGSVTVNVEANSDITALTSATAPNNNAPYGIGAFSFGPGTVAPTSANPSDNIIVTTSSGDFIHSGSSGIQAVNQATAIAADWNAVVSVTAAGTIQSGTIPNNSNTSASGIVAGFFGGIGVVSPGTTQTVGTPNLAVTGTVIVNNTALITAAGGVGINAFNFGNGDVTVNDSGTSVSGAQNGIVANAESGGTGNVAVNVGPGASVTGVTNFGILATGTDDGNISVATSSGDVINSGSAGIAAVNQGGNVDAGDFIAVVANGIINSGTATAGGNIAAGILASYDPGLLNTPNGSVHGDISINDFASIVAPVGTDGISGDNYGTGTVTVVAEAGATITAGRFGIAALGFDGGNVSITNHATVSGGTAAIDAATTSTGTVTIDNSGSLTGLVIAYNASFTNESGGDWSFNGTSAFTGTSNLINLGAIDSNGTSDISGLSGIANSGTIEVQSGSLKLDAGVSGMGTLTIDIGGTLELTSSVSNGQTVVFSSTTGLLTLDQAENFNGVVSGFSTVDGTPAHSDQIDLADINHDSPNFNENFNSATDTLTVTDGTNTAVIQFEGTIGTLNFVDDGNPVNGVNGTSGTIVFDPPIASQSAAPTAEREHSHAPRDTIVAAGQNQNLGGSVAGDNFVFNFAGAGHATGTDFHQFSDTLHSGNPSFANALAVLKAAQADGHADIAVDSHDSTATGSVLKAHLHAADFHIA